MTGLLSLSHLSAALRRLEDEMDKPAAALREAAAALLPLPRRHRDSPMAARQGFVQLC